MQKKLNQKVFLENIFSHISPKRKRQFIKLFFLSIITSLSEGFSLGAIIPFIGIIVSPDLVMHNPMISIFTNNLKILNPNDLIVPITVSFGFLALMTGFLRLKLLKYSTNLGNNIGADFSSQIFKLTLYQPYNIHIERSSSEVISGITQKIATLTSVLVSLITVFSLIFLFFTLTITLFLVNFYITIISLFSFALVYSIIIYFSKKKLLNNSEVVSKAQQSVLKNLQESLGAIRDVLIDGTQDEYCINYNKSVIDLQNASSSNIYLNQSPRFILESFAMVLISILILLGHFFFNNLSTILPSLSVLALGSQRLLPVMNSIYGNWSNFNGNKKSIEDVMELLNQKIPLRNQFEDKIIFKNIIELNNIYFKYKSNQDFVLKNCNLKIIKGSRIGFIGSTGSGKSTLFDIIMGLLTPTVGNVFVDDILISEKKIIGFQKIISHVPQVIFLADKSIEENIAFGIPKSEINKDRVRSAAKMAMLSSFIETIPDGYETVVGERGVKLSGGQRQRIGIARALYKKSDILIFDEATSALDNETELEVMETIEKLDNNLTILIIAHRITTLKKCDIIYLIKNGEIQNGKKYNEIFK
jgi:ABC-type multidrug transport system fused ATPase/permease subunit